MEMMMTATTGAILVRAAAATAAILVAAAARVTGTMFEPARRA